MQGHGRYVIQRLDRLGHTIYDTSSRKLYILSAYPLMHGRTAYVSVVEARADGVKSSRYAELIKETMGVTLQFSEWLIVEEVMAYILNALEHDGEDITNPVDTAAHIGAELHGEYMNWPALPHNMVN